MKLPLYEHKGRKVIVWDISSGNFRVVSHIKFSHITDEGEIKEPVFKNYWWPDQFGKAFKPTNQSIEIGWNRIIE